MTPVQLSMHELSQLVVLQWQRGRSREEIVRVLLERGWPEVSAVRFVNTVLSEQAARQVPAQEPEEKPQQQPTRRIFTGGQDMWRVLVLVILIMALLTVCMFASYAR